MPSPVSSIFRLGFALTAQRLKMAVSSYASDRADQARRTAIGYAVAAGLYMAAGVFVIAACLVGAGALFRWIEVHEGTFAAFGVTGGVLLAGAILCAVIAAGALHAGDIAPRPLSNRVRSALSAPGPTDDRRLPARAAATAAPVRKIADAPVRPAPRPARPRPPSAPSSIGSRVSSGAGLLMVTTLLGWAMARRFNYPRKPENVRPPRR